MPPDQASLLSSTGHYDGSKKQNIGNQEMFDIMKRKIEDATRLRNEIEYIMEFNI
jgi:hypothetical protein